MNLLTSVTTPFQIQLCFDRAIGIWERAPASAERDELLREVAANLPGTHRISKLEDVVSSGAFLGRLLAPYFPEALTGNEIKAVTMPYTNILINPTRRFQKILDEGGTGADILIRDFDEHQSYILSCCLILNEIYGTQLDFRKPLFYDIPSAEGITRHYRILYNADFVDILPTPRSRTLTADEIQQLTDSYDDLGLWKEMFPPESWILRGFSFITLIDVTVENAVSLFKEKMLGLHASGLQESLESIFRSIYQLPDIRIGFVVYNESDDTLNTEAFGRQMRSFLLGERVTGSAGGVLCAPSYQKVIEGKDYFAIGDTIAFRDEAPEGLLAQNFADQGIASFILAPVVKNGRLMGILEVISYRPKKLNSINAHKLEVVMPFLTETVERTLVEMEKGVQAVIQEKFTSLHASVYWKFQAEARRYIRGLQDGSENDIREIVFHDIYPLFGQLDIHASSETRNNGLQIDIQQQLSSLLELLGSLHQLPGTKYDFTTLVTQLTRELELAEGPVRASTEQFLSQYMENEVYPRLQAIEDPAGKLLVDAYLKEDSRQTGLFYQQRRKYELTVSTINDVLAGVLDEAQVGAQAIFPHYYERSKTDGVEHNLYIGASIAPKQPFSISYLHALRFWQLKVLCEMEMAHHEILSYLPFPLHLTGLVLAYGAAITIRFRNDEKRLDIDGSYNARYVIIKKRLDKAFRKDRNERITQPGHLTIVFADDEEGNEYRGYLERLQQLFFVGPDIDNFEVEDLQGVSGLKALRVGFLHLR